VTWKFLVDAVGLQIWQPTCNDFWLEVPPPHGSANCWLRIKNVPDAPEKEWVTQGGGFDTKISVHTADEKSVGVDPQSYGGGELTCMLISLQQIITSLRNR